MHHSEIAENTSVKKSVYTVALIGNPNCGKSTVFNQLTGLRQKTGNFPGVTVDKKLGKVKLDNGQKVNFIDFPGAYSLYPNSQDERIVLNILADPSNENYPDLVLYIADVNNLEKHLLLFTQVKDLGLPVILALNMTDVAEDQGISFDTENLSKKLEVKVIPVSGRTGADIPLLKSEVSNFISSHKEKKRVKPFYVLPGQESKIAAEIAVEVSSGSPYHALLLAHHFEQLPFLSENVKQKIETICKKESFESLKSQVNETMKRYDIFSPVVASAVSIPETTATSLTDKIDRIITHRVLGPLIFIALMALVFQAIFAWSGYPMDLIDMGFGWLDEVVASTVPDGWVSSLLRDGILAGLGGVLIFIPQIAILFFLIALLEEVGYMSRVVFMFDKVMQKFGLNGRSIVALVSGGACAIPAVMSTRTIGNWKERLITILVTPLISCSARIPVYTVLIGLVIPAILVMGVFNLQGLVFLGLYMLGIIFALLSAWVFKKILKSNESSYLMIEMPPYRQPSLFNVGLTVYEKVKTFVVEAGKIIFLISIVLWVLASYGPGNKMSIAETEAISTATEMQLDEQATADLIASKQIEASYAGHLGKFIEPVIRPLGFDWKIGIALITSFAAREVFVGTMATIYSIGSVEEEGTIRDKMARELKPDGTPVYSLATAMSLLIFYVFAMQCMSTVAVVRRETKTWKWPIIQFLFMTILAYLGSLIVYQLLS
ncbi:MAG: ferrous iron transport protein B [Bacteroidota bacterium]